ncbi:MAG: Transcriptional regulator [Cyanobacteria bacterium RYN_339]|nr:Transcriptional regulator [Cyanobacteria bacterium RYN_339]
MGEKEVHTERVCAQFHRAIELIGRRWTGAIIFSLTQKPRRFSDFKDAIPELSDRLLTERLKELEDEGVVVREVSTGRPIQVVYRLTAKGAALQPVFDAIGQWAHRHPPAEQEAVR